MDVSRDPTRVLLVEDSPTDADLVQDYLSEMGGSYDIDHVARLSDAERHLADAPFDIILLDLGLPDTEGLSGLDQIRAAAPEVPIIVLTGSADSELPRAALARGAQDFLPKNSATSEYLARTIEYAVERHQLSRRVRQSEGRLRGVLRAAPIGMGLVRTPPTLREAAKSDRIIDSVNDGFCTMLGYAEEDVVGRSARMLYENDEEFERVGRVKYAQVAQTGIGAVETRFRRDDGETIDVDLRSTLLDPENPAAGAIFTVLDITERKRANQSLKKTNRALHTISQCNQVLVRATSEQQLLFDICRTIIEYGGYRMAWVGFPENDARKSIRPVAHYGHEKGFLDLASPSWEDVEGRYCPPGAAIRKGTPQLLHNLAEYPEFACDLEAALKRGYAACAAFPLKDDDHVFGTLTVFAGEPMAFDDAEAALLQELADDLAYGILALRESAERRRAERELEKAHQRLTAAIESLPDGFAIFGSDDRLALFNEKYREIYAESAEVIRIGMAFEELIRFGLDHGQYVDAEGCEDKWLAERLAKHRDPSGAVEQELPDDRWVLVREERTPNGEWVGARTDITELKRAEQAVERSKTILQAILDSTDDTVLMLDRKGRVLAINRSGASRFGKEPADLIGCPMIEYYSAEDATPRRQAFDEVLTTGRPIVREFQWSGRTREAKVNPVFGVGKDPVALTVYSRDITQRRSSEEDLRKLSRAVEQSPAIVLITDPDGNIEYVNPKFTEVTGYTAEEAIGQNARILKSGEKSPEEYQELWDTISRGDEYRGEFHNKRKDGGLYWAAASISPIRDADGNTTHFVGIQEDITARREAELKARQADKMEALGNLAGGIAHDLNNMLLPVMLLTGEAKKALPEDSPSRADLDQVMDVLDRAKDMVSRILAFSRQDEPHQEIAEVGDLVAQSLPFLRSVVPSTIGIDAAIEPEAGFVAVDTTQLHNVLMNLAANAADALEGRTGQIGIAVAAVGVDAALAASVMNLRPGRYARISVSDTGDGMDSETLKRAFDPFFTTKDVGKGTGMGLAMVHGIVSKHGGAVHVESAPGRGTRFDLYFPAAEGPQPNE